jgi:tetratricopeptide (TPR) repeat protein
MTNEVQRANHHPRVGAAINAAIDLDDNGDAHAAIQLLRDVLSEFPHSSALHTYLGLYLMETREYTEARHHSEQATKLSPMAEKASWVHFFVLWNSGQHIEALDEMKRFLTLRPSKLYEDIIKENELFQ